jgi:hypothetical protein
MCLTPRDATPGEYTGAIISQPGNPRSIRPKANTHAGIVGDDLRLLRQQGAVPVLIELHEYLLKIREEVLPKSPAGQAADAR